MADATNFTRSALWAAWLELGPFYLAAFTGATDGDEVAADGYGRQLVTFGAESVPGTAATNVDAVFGALAGTGTVTHLAVFDAEEGGNRLSAIKAVTTPRTWLPGGSIRCAAGSFSVQIA